jgi:hypothetical protein
VVRTVGYPKDAEEEILCMTTSSMPTNILAMTVVMGYRLIGGVATARRSN